MQPSAQGTGAGLPCRIPPPGLLGQAPVGMGVEQECGRLSPPPRPLRVRRAAPGALSSSAHAWTSAQRGLRSCVGGTGGCQVRGSQRKCPGLPGAPPRPQCGVPAPTEDSSPCRPPTHSAGPARGSGPPGRGPPRQDSPGTGLLGPCCETRTHLAGHTEPPRVCAPSSVPSKPPSPLCRRPGAGSRQHCLQQR